MLENNIEGTLRLICPNIYKQSYPLAPILFVQHALVLLIGTTTPYISLKF
jgi:hypothetical protein